MLLDWTGLDWTQSHTLDHESSGSRWSLRPLHVAATISDLRGSGIVHCQNGGFQTFPISLEEHTGMSAVRNSRVSLTASICQAKNYATEITHPDLSLQSTRLLRASVSTNVVSVNVNIKFSMRGRSGVNPIAEILSCGVHRGHRRYPLILCLLGALSVVSQQGIFRKSYHSPLVGFTLLLLDDLLSFVWVGTEINMVQK